MKIKLSLLAGLLMSTLSGYALAENPDSFDNTPHEDEVVFSLITTHQFATSVVVQRQLSDIDEGLKILRRPDGSCYETRKEITSVSSEDTGILETEIQLVSTNTQQREVDCPTAS